MIQIRIFLHMSDNDNDITVLPFASDTMGKNCTKSGYHIKISSLYV